MQNLIEVLNDRIALADFPLVAGVSILAPSGELISSSIAPPRVAFQSIALQPRLRLAYRSTRTSPSFDVDLAASARI